MDWAEEQDISKRYREGEYKQIHGGSWDEWFARPDLRLIPSLAEKFWVYGGEDTVARARKWALDNRYLLVQGPDRCADGLYLLPCPAHCYGRWGFDHTGIWVPYDEPRSPFILTHPYADEVPDEMRTYAKAHGLEVSSSRQLDGWYSDSALPIRLTVTKTSTFPWPLATRAIVLINAFPVDWPEGDGIGERS